jgi:hypothetical protein
MAAALRLCFQRFTDFLGVKQIRVDPQLAEQQGLEWIPDTST